MATIIIITDPTPKDPKPKTKQVVVVSDTQSVADQLRAAADILDGTQTE